MSKKSPQLRFEGFTDDWEERKFGELYKKMNEKNDLSFGKDRVISVANMYFKDTGNIRSDDAYMKTYNIFRTGDIAFEGNRSKHFAYGRFVENTIGDGIVSHVFDVFRPIQQFDLNYWKYAIHNERVMGPILMTATTSSTMMTNLVAKDFLKRAILVPSYSEQKLVGSFFKQLDDTIALHQRKLDLLKEQKKGYLQKMFPKTGEKIPELRFAGFADDWEERKLSEGTSKIGDGLHGTPNYSDNGDVFFINGNNLVNGKIVITKETKLVTESNQSKDDKLLNMDTILMSINGTIGNLAWYNNERVMLGKSAAYLTVSNFDKKFIFSYLQTSTIKNYFLNNLTGTTIKNLGLKTIRDTTLFVPTLEEQQKIGSLFKQLDDTIALHQRKLDLLKEQKKGFLQKMFV